MISEKQAMNKIYEKYFKDRNWDRFDKEQIRIIGDVAYVIVY